MKILITILTLINLNTSNSFAASSPQKVPDAKTLEKVFKFNSELKYSPLRTKDLTTVTRPVADYEKIKYLIMNNEFLFDSEHVKKEILNNLPDDVTPVIITTALSANTTANKFDTFIDPNRLKYLKLNDARQIFWARDGVPVPVLSTGESPFSIVDARYYYKFYSGSLFGDIFNAHLFNNPYYYEGGNFAATDDGQCFMVNNKRHSQIPDDVFTSLYGCRSLTRLAHLTGIGHVDEVLRLMPNKVAFTADPQYIPILEKQGLTVELLPKPRNYYETYANSLIVNGTVFLPVYNESTDATAVALYEKYGLKVVPIETLSLSNTGKGSIHCITMTYPEIALEKLAKMLNASEIH